MIDPIDTEREPREDVSETRIFPNPVVPIGTGTMSVSPGVIPGIALGTDPEDVAGTGSDESDKPWHYRTQEEVGAQNDFSAEASGDELPDAGDHATGESDSRPDATI